LIYYDYRRVVILDDLSLGIEQEFSKVPGNIFSVKRRVVSKPLVEGNSSGPIDINFGHEGESDSVVIPSPLFNFGIGARFLITKLVAGESIDIKTLVMILGIDSLQLFVINRGQTSVRGYIHDQVSFFTSTDIF
jgi:hypothetical protein